MFSSLAFVLTNAFGYFSFPHRQ